MDEPPHQSEPPSVDLNSADSVVEALKASQLKDVIHQFGEALRARRKGIDRMNVYPVPDGDTGTNMSLTVQSVVTELKSAASDDMHAIASAISKGAIMGARGNSGAILAQALRGVAESAKEKSSLTPGDVADALEKARKGAYESVLKPVEGTILTVLSAAATAARKSADEGHKLKEQLDNVRAASAEALGRTPDLLPVLKQAGVVDAGGSGFLLFIDALRYVATGEPIPGITDAEEGDDADGPELSHTEHSELSDLRYEIMFLLTADDEVVPQFREAWSAVGDSIVVVGGDGIWNSHIHSDDIGKAIEVALDFGRPSNIRITDLMEQVGEAHGAEWGDGAVEATPVATAIVAVVNGDGVADMYRQCGVQQLVIGGQSMNPSVSELLSAVETAPSTSVIILPNNKNIHAAANQVNDLTDKEVMVLPTTSVVQGLASLVNYDSNATAADVIAALRETADVIVCGEVTQAVRKSVSDAGPIKKGDWLGIGPTGISVVAADQQSALCELVNVLTTDNHELLTVVEGVGASTEVTNALKTWVSENRPSLEVEVHVGGQPLYPYLIGAE